MSALVDKKTVMHYYREATEEPFSFLCRLEAKKPEDIFWCRFEHRLVDRDEERVVNGRAGAGRGENSHLIALPV